MEAYKTWVRRNKDYVHSLQSLANGLTWLLPERFSNSQIGPEAVTATLGTLTAINEHIIDTAPEESHTGLADPLSFPYGLYISALKDLGTLVEVVAEQYYGDKRWSFIAVRKLPTLCQNCGYKMLLHGGETPNVGKILMIQVYNIKLGASLLSRFGESAWMISDPLWVQRSKQQHAIMKPQTSTIERRTLSMILSEKCVNRAVFILGKVLFITRPLRDIL
ncbi:hypothetical protein ERO13_A11G084200v2 [Gossypium hirsutum]|uniref:Peroxisomal membrane protein PEX16 n=1 Tax=Gossypium darwinii TaxID=34276 RepID=A0A5D2EJ82_GOSDA|nr:hypothetical protein ERO13_A11G084200v2 [Gossypium hirsutum]TYG93260.1 hypothetical protein ES288_A11G096300v1 [Gossypium darwinii]TYG93265.1 hypothetical protein ES288_A11G096800v1 [Gossypium darwinii]